MRLYDMLENSNRQIIAQIAELDAVDRNNILERNIRFERLKESVLHIFDARKRTIYATLVRYSQLHQAVDQLQHMQVQIAGMLDALSRESIASDEWESLLLTLKQWLKNTITFEEGEVTRLAKCYLTPEQEEQLMRELDVENHFLEKNTRLENSAEEGFNDEYTAYKKALDNPGKSHLPPKRWRMGSM